MARSKTLFAVITCVFALGMTSATTIAGTIAYSLTDISGATNMSADDFVLGFEFTPQQTIWVDALGIHDRDGDGLSNAHAVGLWRVSDQSLIASATVASGTSATLIDEFRFQSITLVSLSAGTSYRIGAVYPDADPDDLFWLAPVIAIDSTLTFVNDTKLEDTSPSVLAYPNQSAPGFRSTANFTFVPEPATFGMLLAGLMVLSVAIRRR